MARRGFADLSVVVVCESAFDVIPPGRHESESPADDDELQSLAEAMLDTLNGDWRRRGIQHFCRSHACCDFNKDICTDKVCLSMQTLDRSRSAPPTHHIVCSWVVFVARCIFAISIVPSVVVASQLISFAMPSSSLLSPSSIAFACRDHKGQCSVDRSKSLISR